MAVKFEFMVKADTPSQSSVVHLFAREAGADKVWFDKTKVKASYEGTVDDPEFKALAELFESYPEHRITLATQ